LLEKNGSLSAMNQHLAERLQKSGSSRMHLLRVKALKWAGRK
jgi:hypothetical protein